MHILLFLPLIFSVHKTHFYVNIFYKVAIVIRNVCCRYVYFTDVDECNTTLLSPCDANAMCTNTEGSFMCTCNQGYRLSSGSVCIGMHMFSFGEKKLFVSLFCSHLALLEILSCSNNFMPMRSMRAIFPVMFCTCIPKSIITTVKYTSIIETTRRR